MDVRRSDRVCSYVSGVETSGRLADMPALRTADSDVDCVLICHRACQVGARLGLNPSQGQVLTRESSHMHWVVTGQRPEFSSRWRQLVVQPGGPPPWFVCLGLRLPRPARLIGRHLGHGQEVSGAGPTLFGGGLSPPWPHVIPSCICHTPSLSRPHPFHLWGRKLPGRIRTIPRGGAEWDGNYDGS